jgi:hypothetical protein
MTNKQRRVMLLLMVMMVMMVMDDVEEGVEWIVSAHNLLVT